MLKKFMCFFRPLLGAPENFSQQKFRLFLLSPKYHHPQNVTYIKRVEQMILLARLQIQLHNQFSREILIACGSVLRVRKQQLQLHKELLRELFLLPGYNYNYMNCSPANYLRNNFADHGRPCRTSEIIAQKLTYVLSVASKVITDIHVF